MNIEEIINNIQSDKRISITYVSEVKLKGGKSNPLQGLVEKETIASGIELSSKDKYLDKLKDKYLEEGKDPETIELKSRPWGQRVGDSPIIEHKDSKYLECFFNDNTIVKTKYYLNGYEHDPELIEGLELKEKNEDKGVNIRCIKFENIVSLRV